MVGDRFGVSSRPKYSLVRGDNLSRNKPGDWKNEWSALYEVVVQGKPSESIYVFV